MRTRRARSRLSTESIAGWILADILVVLFIVGLGSAVPPKIEAATTKPSPTPTPTATPPKPTPKPRPQPQPRIVGMKTKPTVLEVGFSRAGLTQSGSAGKTARRGLCRTLDRKVSKIGNHRAALVLIFAGGSEVEAAQRNAKAVGAQLDCADASIFTGTPVRPFWDGGLPANRARLEVFQFTTTQEK